MPLPIGRLCDALLEALKFRSLSSVSAPYVLASPAVATVTVTDDDTSPATSNPLDETRFFVTQQYQDFLNREPDEEGLNFWSHEIDQCGEDSGCFGSGAAAGVIEYNRRN